MIRLRFATTTEAYLGRYHSTFFASLVGLVSYKSLFSPFILRFDSHEGPCGLPFCGFHGACRLQKNKDKFFFCVVSKYTFIRGFTH